MLAMAFAELRRDNGMTRSEVARALHLPPSELEGLIFGLALAAVDGHGTSRSAPRGHLRLVLAQTVHAEREHLVWGKPCYARLSVRRKVLATALLLDEFKYAVRDQRTVHDFGCRSNLLVDLFRVKDRDRFPQRLGRALVSF